MPTEAQQKAKNNYRKKTKHVAIELNTETESDLIEYIYSLDNKQSYIKELIRKDMKEKEQG